MFTVCFAPLGKLSDFLSGRCRGTGVLKWGHEGTKVRAVTPPAAQMQTWWRTGIEQYTTQAGGVTGAIWRASGVVLPSFPSVLLSHLCFPPFPSSLSSSFLCLSLSLSPPPSFFFLFLNKQLAYILYSTKFMKFTSRLFFISVIFPHD